MENNNQTEHDIRVGRSFLSDKLIPGYNVDKLNIDYGMLELIKCGYPATEKERHLVIEYALQRWKRGEEAQAQRAAIDESFYGITLTCWLRVLAAAMAGDE